jgi:hypothetical protein
MKPIRTDGWLTVDDLSQHLPITLYDANGTEVRRAIVAFDPQSGYVKSNILRRDGAPIVNEAAGELLRRVEKFPAPLVWRSISRHEAKRIIRCYWDLNENNT